MARVTFDIPDDRVQPIVDALCAAYGYQATLPNGAPNPLTREDFAMRCVTDFVINHAVAYQHRRIDATTAAAKAAVAADIRAVPVTATLGPS